MKVLLSTSKIAGSVLVGPMHSETGVELYKKAVADAQAAGGKIQYGGKVHKSLLLKTIVAPVNN